MAERFYTRNSYLDGVYYEFPRCLLKYKKYKSMSAGAKILYTVLKDSILEWGNKDIHVDSNSDTYIQINRKALAELLGFSVKTVSQYLSELEDYRLAHVVPRNKVYVAKIVSSTEEDC